MLSNEDIKRITEAQIEAQKEIFYIKDDLNEKFTQIQSSIDSFAKSKLASDQETPIINDRIEKMEKWVDKAAPKIGVDFKH